MNEILDIVFRTGIVYLAIITGLRLLGRQHMGQITINDFVLILLIANSVQNAMVGSNTSLTGGLIAAGVLLVLNYLVSALIYESVSIRKLLSGEQVILVYNGHYQDDNLKKVQITHDELEGIIREHGCENVKGIHSAILETDGTISVIPDAEGEKPKIFRHTRRKKRKPNQNQPG
jgi:uncharacterized membrane protein YcaP (DUF421 family)